MEAELINAFGQLKDTALSILIIMPGIAVGLFALNAWMETDSAGPRRRRGDRAW
jgi:uncharacterized membrane protein YdfJ with MMPL/SSD domain